MQVEKLSNLSREQQDTIHGLRYTYFQHIGFFRRLESKGKIITQESYQEISELYNLMIDLVAHPESHGKTVVIKDYVNGSNSERETQGKTSGR